MTQRVVVVGATGRIGRAALAALAHGIRTVLQRTGYVLTPDSLASQAAQFRRHLGGYGFRFPGLDAALRDLLDRPDHAAAAGAR
jgi:hypothetical protein